jgi:hypothetical protein
MNSRFHHSLFMNDKDFVSLKNRKRVSPRLALKMYIQYCVDTTDTFLPENCVFRLENVIDMMEGLYLNERIRLKYYEKEGTGKFRRKLREKLDEHCSKERLRSVRINGERYYEAN